MKYSWLLDVTLCKTVRVTAETEAEALRLGREAIIDELGHEVTIEGEIDVVEQEDAFK